MLRLLHDDGTVGLRRDAPPPERALALGIPALRHDPRVEALRAPGYRYAAIVRALVGRGVPFADEARKWNELALAPAPAGREARDYQLAAIAAWRAWARRGVVV